VLASRLFLRGRNSTTRILSIVVAFFLSVMVGLAFFLMIASGGEDSDALLMLLPPLLVLTVPFLQREVLLISARSVFEHNPKIAAPRTVWIFDDRVEEISETDRSVFRWEEIDGAAEDAGMLLLWSSMQVMAFPADQLDAAAAVYLHNLLLAKLQSRFRFFSAVLASGTLSAPEQEQPEVPLYRAIFYAQQCQRELPVLTLDLPNRPTGSRSWAATAIFGALFSLVLALLYCTQEKTPPFVSSFFWICWTACFLVLCAITQLSIWLSLRRNLRAEPEIRLVLLPEGLGMDTGRNSSLIEWKSIRVREASSAFWVKSDVLPGKRLKIEKSLLSPQAAESLRNWLIRGCGDRFEGKQMPRF